MTEEEEEEEEEVQSAFVLGVGRMRLSAMTKKLSLLHGDGTYTHLEWPKLPGDPVVRVTVEVNAPKIVRRIPKPPPPKPEPEPLPPGPPMTYKERILMERDSIDTYTVYFNPVDFPHQYVVRRFVVHETPDGKGTAIPDLIPTAVCSSLKEARRWIPGLMNRRHLRRSPEDEEPIVEYWI